MIFSSGNCYAIVNESLSFAQAAKHCSENSGKLASFEGREGWDEMVAALADYENQTIGFWIGNYSILVQKQIETGPNSVTVGIMGQGRQLVSSDAHWLRDYSLGGVPESLFAANASSFANRFGTQSFHPFVLFVNGTADAVDKSEAHPALCEFVGQ